MLEVVLAIAIAVAAFIPIMDSLGGLRSGFNYSRKRTTAIFLAHAILDGIRYRLYEEGPFGAGDASATQEKRVALSRFFEGLAEQGALVATDDEGLRSRYFAELESLEGTTLHGITSAHYPVSFPRLRDYRCRIEAFRDGPSNDADGDGTPEADLCELKVTLFWQERVGGAERSLTLWTVITSRWRTSDV